jgi:hypothetical protein
MVGRETGYVFSGVDCPDISKYFTIRSPRSSNNVELSIPHSAPSDNSHDERPLTRLSSNKGRCGSRAWKSSGIRRCCGESGRQLTCWTMRCGRSRPTHGSCSWRAGPSIMSGTGPPSSKPKRIIKCRRRSSGIVPYRAHLSDLKDSQVRQEWSQRNASNPCETTATSGDVRKNGYQLSPCRPPHSLRPDRRGTPPGQRD